MNFVKLINNVITFCVLLAIFAIVMTALGPFLGDMGVHTFPGIPGKIIKAIWDAITGPIFAAGFTVCIVVMFMIYIIWKIIKMFVPNFPIPFKMILLKIPPLPQLERAGIFALFDSIVGVVLSRASFGNRLMKVGFALGDFVKRNFEMVMSIAKDTAPNINFGGKESKSKDEQDNEAIDNNPDLTEQEKIEKKQSKNINSPFTDTEKQIVNEQYQLCIAENTTPITSDMSKSDITKAKTANDLAKIKCDLSKLSAFSNALNFK